MTEQSKDGGPAFPSIENRYDGGAGTKAVMAGGMSLRDWFAGQIIGAMFTHSAVDEKYDDIAEEAYALADAMLAQRAKTEGGE